MPNAARCSAELGGAVVGAAFHGFKISTRLGLSVAVIPFGFNGNVGHEMAGILSWWKSRKYRKEARDRLHAILFKFPGEMPRIEQLYPSIGATIEKCCTEGRHPAYPAAIVGGSILADLILTHWDEEDRHGVLNEWRQFDFTKLQGKDGVNFMALDGLSGGTQWVVLAMGLVAIWAQKGELSDQEADFFNSSVLGALEGKDHHQRGVERTSAIIREHLLGP